MTNKVVKAFCFLLFAAAMVVIIRAALLYSALVWPFK